MIKGIVSIVRSIYIYIDEAWYTHVSFIRFYKHYIKKVN